MNIFRLEYDPEKYFTVKYNLRSTVSLRDAAWNLAIGQSMGNPKYRSLWETEEMFERSSCVIIGDEAELATQSEGMVIIGFPVENINWEEDGISHLLCNIMGGQLDISTITKCQILDIEFPDSVKKCFLGPKYGITGVREYTKCYNKPLLGGIIKPKTGCSAETILEITKTLVEGGVNFIKEDEILSNPNFCTLKDRVRLISPYLAGKGVIYTYAINADYPYCIDRVKYIHEMGGNGVHINFWSGMGVYNTIRKLDLPMFLHFQKSGDRILTNPSHDFHIDWKVICKLAGMMGVDFIHAGMWGGYKNDDEEELKRVVTVLNSHNVLPALSCGMHPGIVNAVTKRFGIDYMANVGGAIQSHISGPKAGAVAMRQAIDHTYGVEYDQAIEQFGIVK